MISSRLKIVHHGSDTVILLIRMKGRSAGRQPLDHDVVELELAGAHSARIRPIVIGRSSHFDPSRSARSFSRAELADVDAEERDDQGGDDGGDEREGVQQVSPPAAPLARFRRGRIVLRWLWGRLLLVLDHRTLRGAGLSIVTRPVGWQPRKGCATGQPVKGCATGQPVKGCATR